MKKNTDTASDGVTCSSFCAAVRICNPEMGAELKWNSESDEYNQWNNLGQDERDDLIAEFIKTNVELSRGDSAPDA